MFFKFVLLINLLLLSETLCFMLKKEFTEMATELDTQVAAAELCNKLYNIEGHVLTPEPMMGIGKNWQIDTTVTINEEYKGFVRKDGYFIISGVPAGSYVVEVHHPDLKFIPLRVDITQKGKMRARKLNHLQPSRVVLLRYPLRLRPLMRKQFFYEREGWQIMDLILNPMVVIIVLPFLLMLVMPIIINDDEMKQEIDNIPLPRITNDIPDLSEWITKMLTAEQKKLPKPPKQEKARLQQKAK